MEAPDHPFFAKVSAAELDYLLKTSELLDFEDREVIFEENTPSDSLYLIIDGKVSFRKKLPSGHLLTVSVSESGGYFGEIGVLSGEDRALQAESYGPSKVLKISRQSIQEYLQNMPGPIESLLQSVIRHLHHTTRHYVEDMLHQEKMAVVGSMMNTIIHDFKNPFCLISLSAQLVRQRHPDPETEKLCLNIEKQVDRMVEMAGELAEFSRGEHKLKTLPIGLQELMDEFRNLNFPFFENESIPIIIDLPEVRIIGEKAKLFRVFQNLIGNAIDAIGDGPGHVELSGHLQRDQGLIEIRVKDNGNGIPEAIRNRFFEPFVTFGKSEGTGLGTAIVKSIVEAHRGTIRFETATGKGTTFFLTLPLAE
jgi:signal transduction histidine kinase